MSRLLLNNANTIGISFFTLFLGMFIGRELRVEPADHPILNPGAVSEPSWWNSKHAQRLAPIPDAAPTRTEVPFTPRDNELRENAIDFHVESASTHGGSDEELGRLTTLELARLDLIPHIDSVESAMNSRLLNPNRRELLSASQSEVAKLLSEARVEVTNADAIADKQLFDFLNSHRHLSRSIPPGQDFSTLKKNIYLEQPADAKIIHTTSSETGESYLVVNWGDSIEFDNARIQSGDVKLRFVERIRACFKP